MKISTLKRPIFALGLAFSIFAGAQTRTRDNQSLAEGRAFIQKQEYARAIQVLQAGLKSSPNDVELKTELGKAYLYSHQDDRAITIFNQALASSPKDKDVNLELARALSYRREFEASNRRYRQLLAYYPGYEQAQVGLIRNLIHEKKYAEAKSELASAMKANPGSPRLEELQKRINSGHAAASERMSYSSRVQVSESFLSDSGGNRSLRSGQSAEYWFTPKISTRLQAEEKRLWRDTWPTSNISWATDEIKLRPMSSFALIAGGGAARFSNGSTRSLYRGTLELHPHRSFFLSGGFGRAPFAPTTQAAQLNLMSEGWFTRFEGDPGPWRLNAGWSHQHFTDGNRSTREDVDLLRWVGGPRFAVAAGYRYNHAHFANILNHGYFSPDNYNSNLGITGIRFNATKHWSAEYLTRVGVEKVDTTPLRAAVELSFRNRFIFNAWEVGADYSYYRIAQDAGPFTAHLPRVTLTRRF